MSVFGTRNPQIRQAERQLEAAIRKGNGLTDARWKLIELGLDRDEVHQAEQIIGRRVKEERGAA